jgi:1-acyl-sn-glycerol-3-phosphate acyltransferase
VIYFANHSSHLDFLTIWAALPAAARVRTRPVAGRDYWEKTAHRRRIARDFFNAVLIERQHVTVATNPLAPMLAALEAGDSLIVFPEGTRSADGAIHEFKSGLYHLARGRPGIPLVPVYLQNLSRILPKGDFCPCRCSAASPRAPLTSEPAKDKRPIFSSAPAPPSGNSPPDPCKLTANSSGSSAASWPCWPSPRPSRFS